MKLEKFNNKLLKFNSKLMKFENPVRNVHILQSTNGSISAIPLSGIYGTEVTLSNTPDEGYVFNKYSVTGSKLYDGNKFRIGNKDVTVSGTFKHPAELWVNLPDQYYLQGDQRRNMTVNLTGMPQESDYMYFTMVYRAMIWGSTGGAARWLLQRSGDGSPENGSQGKYRMWDHFVLTTPPYFFCQDSGLVWTTDPSAASFVGSGPSTSLFPENSWESFKLVVDRANRLVHVYIRNTYLGIASNFNIDPIEWSFIYLFSDQGRSYERAGVWGLKIAGFSTLEDAKAWDGGDL